MALFVQIDHFRKTDQKPTVKNHLFSISWFRSFNRTSFQQQLKPLPFGEMCARTRLQSYILSTTTETTGLPCFWIRRRGASIVHPFNNNWNLLKGRSETDISSFNRTSFQQQLKRGSSTGVRGVKAASIVHPFNNNWNMTEWRDLWLLLLSFNRTSFQQQLKLIPKKRENSAPDQTQPNF